MAYLQKKPSTESHWTFLPVHVTRTISSPHGEDIFSLISDSVWDRYAPSILREVGNYDWLRIMGQKTSLLAGRPNILTVFLPVTGDIDSPWNISTWILV